MAGPVPQEQGLLVTGYWPLGPGARHRHPRLSDSAPVTHTRLGDDPAPSDGGRHLTRRSQSFSCTWCVNYNWAPQPVRPRISALLLTLCNPPVPQTLVTTEHEAWIPSQLLGPHVCAVSRGCLVSESPVPPNTTWGSPRVKKSIGLGKLQLGSRYIHKGGQSHIQRNPNPNKEGFLPVQVSVAEGENKTQNCRS